MLVYALILTVVYGVISIPAIVAVFINRKHPYIVSRDPFLLLVQTIGSLVAGTLLMLYIALKPHYRCEVFYLGSSVAFCFFANPLCTRIWAYCVQVHLSLLRNQFRSNTKLEKGWEQKHWFFRNKWAGSYKFLQKAFFVTTWLWMIPLIPQIFYVRDSATLAYNQYESCTVYNGSVEISIVFFLIYFAFSIIAAVLTWGAHDIYKIKTELKILLSTWVVIAIIWVPWASISFSGLRTVPASFWICIGLYFSFFATTVFSLVLVYMHPKKDAESSEKFQGFLDALEMVPFRNEFFEYLAKQFCQENLLFYEAVTDWKRLVDPVAKHASAMDIRETFILDTGLCQVNIDSSTRDVIEAKLLKQPSDLPDDIYDEALTAVLRLMHVNSYVPFRDRSQNLIDGAI